MKIIYRTSLIIFFAIAGCEKFSPVKPSFDVKADKTAYKAGEDVLFSFSGNPDNITFFSGEAGHRYEYNNRAIAKGTPVLNFSTQLDNGKQESLLHLMVSKDFSGIGDDSVSTLNNIRQASWTDITHVVSLSEGPKISSGDIDLSAFSQDGKPVFIAFKYIAQPGTRQNKWTIRDLKLKNILEDGTSYTIADLSSHLISNYGVSTIIGPGWTGYAAIGSYKWIISGSSIVITGATTDASSTSAAESWAIMGPVQLDRVSPDTGVPIKEISGRVPDYLYHFSVPGDYQVTFVAGNNNVYGSEETIKQLKITVSP